MSLSEQINGVLGHNDLSNFLAEQTSAINTAFAQGQIAPDERDALLEDLINTNVIIQGANDQDMQIFLDRVLTIVKSAPLPS